MRLFRTMIFTIVVVWAIAALGCATRPEPFDYEPDNELKKGPGLFSGEKGAFTIYTEPLESKVPDSNVSGKGRQEEKAEPSDAQ